MTNYGRAGLLRAGDAPDGAAEAILALCERPDKRKRMGESGRKRVSALYRHADMLNRYEELFETVRGEARGGHRI